MGSDETNPDVRPTRRALREAERAAAAAAATAVATPPTGTPHAHGRPAWAAPAAATPAAPATSPRAAAPASPSGPSFAGTSFSSSALTGTSLHGTTVGRLGPLGSGPAATPGPLAGRPSAPAALGAHHGPSAAAPGATAGPSWASAPATPASAAGPAGLEKPGLIWPTGSTTGTASARRPEPTGSAASSSTASPAPSLSVSAPTSASSSPASAPSTAASSSASAPSVASAGSSLPTAAWRPQAPATAHRGAPAWVPNPSAAPSRATVDGGPTHAPDVVAQEALGAEADATAEAEDAPTDSALTARTRELRRRAAASADVAVRGSDAQRSRAGTATAAALAATRAGAKKHRKPIRNAAKLGLLGTLAAVTVVVPIAKGGLGATAYDGGVIARGDLPSTLSALTTLPISSLPPASLASDESVVSARELDEASRSGAREALPGCDPTARAAGQNGLLATADLCTLWDGHTQMRADAASALAELNQVYVARFGADMCVSSGYRTLSQQYAVKAQKGGLAATPGKSNHGWGLAIDFCSSMTSGARWDWLNENAGTFGFENPAWARPGGSGPYERWHWEYLKGVKADGEYYG